MPIIKFSVEWWNTLHQPASIVRAGGAAIDQSILYPLLILMAGFTAYYVAVLLWRVRAELLRVKIRARQFEQASGSGAES